MVTVIDMITGEIIHSSRTAAPAQSHEDRPSAWACPALALQEVASEPRQERKMPPELAHIAVEEFLVKF